MPARYDYRPRFNPTALVVVAGVALALSLGMAFAGLTDLPHAQQATMAAQHDVRPK